MSKTISLRNSKLVAIVDDEDFANLAQFKWYLSDRGRACRSVNGTTKFMHYDILEKREKLEIDHINCDKLDNRRSNLRYCTHAQNGQNRPKLPRHKGFKGVYLRPRDQHVKPWQVYITVNGVAKCLGYFSTAIDAAIAYDMAALMWHKEFAYTNILKPCKTN